MISMMTTHIVLERNNNSDKTSIQTADDSDEFIFPLALLKRINWNNRRSSFPATISPQFPGENLVVRPLSIHDYKLGFMPLLSHLTDIGMVSEEKFKAQFRTLKKCPDTYYILVVEDKLNNRIAAATTLVLERKFIHSAGMRGRIEDVVCSEEYRGKQLAKLLVEMLTLLAQDLGCYKISLECKDKLIKYYESFGYQKDEGNNFMVQRFSKL